MLVAQLSDTHIVDARKRYAGSDPQQYLRDAIAAIVGLSERPTCVLVTGDLVNRGKPGEYARFRSIMDALPMPYFVIPGNHDDRDALRTALPSQTFGGSRERTIRFAIDDFEVRLVGLDANRAGSPGAALDDESFAWLEATLAEPKPTIVAIHQPPFRTGLHYLDVFGFRGARRLRALVARHPHVGRVICGHIHCVRRRRAGDALIVSAPSTVPTAVPLVFMGGRMLGVRREPPGFALHAWSTTLGFRTATYRRDPDGTYALAAERDP